MLINSRWLITCLKILIGASRLMSPLALLKAIACLVVVFLSLWISLAERSRSSFALVVSCVQVRSCFLFSAMLMRVVSGRYKLMRVGHHIRVLRLRALMDSILFRAKRMFRMRGFLLPQTLIYLLKRLLASNLLCT
jgi:hypothetical protein